jgi:hypothetical protein
LSTAINEWLFAVFNHTGESLYSNLKLFHDTQLQHKQLAKRKKNENCSVPVRTMGNIGRVQLYQFLTTALHAGKWLNSHPDRFTVAEEHRC